MNAAHDQLLLDTMAKIKTIAPDLRRVTLTRTLDEIDGEMLWGWTCEVQIGRRNKKGAKIAGVEELRGRGETPEAACIETAEYVAYVVAKK